MKPLYGEKDQTREFPIDDGLPYRSPFRRDYARLLHSSAFRRLQGKTQLFPGAESDFFRNRLTHSLEVAQIAKSIALRLNHCHDYFMSNQIDVDLVETAALAHDLGHPPFGHNGERALDDCMKKRGGFEGNAQSLRILARLEKKDPSDSLGRSVGLNLTHRTLASTLKYDEPIPIKRKKKDNLVKGYYISEKNLVGKIKKSILGENADVEAQDFKTIECQIMDLSDDIAYSTYDLEDALKAGFVNSNNMIGAIIDKQTIDPIISKLEIGQADIFRHLLDIWLEPVFDPNSLEDIVDIDRVDLRKGEHLAMLVAILYRKAHKFNADGSARTKLTSHLINECIKSIEVSELNPEFPALSKIRMSQKLQTRVKILKHLTYSLVIQSPSLKTVEYRGYSIVQDIFNALSGKDGDLLLPDDWRKRLVEVRNKLELYRTICDFIAGMTDRYAIEFYGRLHSENAQTMFKPL